MFFEADIVDNLYSVVEIYRKLNRREAIYSIFREFFCCLMEKVFQSAIIHKK